jgi:hypothetical protein
MPTYCYQEGETGRVHERVFAVGTAPKYFKEGGKEYCRCYQAERKSVPSTKGWPMTCYASGVNANQAGELRECLARAGVPTEVTPDGDPVYRSAAHRRKALKVRGFVDRSSYI